MLKAAAFQTNAQVIFLRPRSIGRRSRPYLLRPAERTFDSRPRIDTRRLALVTSSPCVDLAPPTPHVLNHCAASRSAPAHRRRTTCCRTACPRPRCEYNSSRRGDNPASASSTMARIRCRGCRCGPLLQRHVAEQTPRRLTPATHGTDCPRTRSHAADNSLLSRLLDLPQIGALD